MPGGQDEAGDVAQPVLVGAQLQMPGAGRGAAPRRMPARCSAAAAAYRRRSDRLVQTSRCSPVSGSTTASMPTSGSSSSRGSSTSTASSGALSREPAQRLGPGGSARRPARVQEVRHHRQQSHPVAAMGERAVQCRTAPRRGRPAAAAPTDAAWPAEAGAGRSSAGRPERAGTRTRPEPVSTSAPSRLPPRAVSRPMRRDRRHRQIALLHAASPAHRTPGLTPCRSPCWPWRRRAATSPARGRRSRRECEAPSCAP